MSDEKKSIEERREAYEQRKAEREKAKKERVAKLEELEIEFDEKLGPRGGEWEMVELPDEDKTPAIVVKLGTPIAFKKLTESKKTQTDLENFVRPSVLYPDAATYVALVDKRPVYAVRAANALGTLYGMQKEIQSGKF